MAVSRISTLTQGTSRQFTTFDPATGEKTKFVPPGESRVLIDSRDTGVVNRMWFTFPGWFWRYWDGSAPVDPTVLRLTILKIYFDGCELPSVEAPLGDFFGVGHCEYRHFSSQYLGMSSGGFYCYLPMPFAGGFRLEIENRHPTLAAEIFFNINYQKLEALEEGEGRLHCAFHCGENPGGEPLEILNAKGKGHFAGCALSIQGKEPNYLAFLEAPEYIWLDGEAETPAIMGTGLEDYFNGGWYFRNGEFAAPCHGVPLKDPLRSMISMYRFHDGDRINFQEEMRMAFVNPWKKNRLKPFLFSSTAYYYLEKAQGACYNLPDRAALTKLYRVRDRDFQANP